MAMKCEKCGKLLNSTWYNATTHENLNRERPITCGGKLIELSMDKPPLGMCTKCLTTGVHTWNGLCLVCHNK